jgi:ribonucleoside-diphosphate reductase alpha subunit
MPME